MRVRALGFGRSEWLRFNTPVRARSLNRRQSFHGVGKLLDQPNQQGSLRIWLGAALLPVFESAGVGTQIVREHLP